MKDSRNGRKPKLKKEIMEKGSDLLSFVSNSFLISDWRHLALLIVFPPIGHYRCPSRYFLSLLFTFYFLARCLKLMSERDAPAVEEKR